MSAGLYRFDMAVVSARTDSYFRIPWECAHPVTVVAATESDAIRQVRALKGAPAYSCYWAVRLKRVVDVRLPPGGDGMSVSVVIDIHCDECHNWDEMLTMDRNAPGALRRRARSAGWACQDGSDVCPDCVKLLGITPKGRKATPPAPTQSVSVFELARQAERSKAAVLPPEVTP